MTQYEIFSRLKQLEERCSIHRHYVELEIKKINKSISKLAKIQKKMKANIENGKGA